MSTTPEAVNPPLPREPAPPVEETPPPLPTDSSEPQPPLPDEAPKVHKGKGDWQAVWSPDANAYYFWNSITQAVTWENPLVPPSTEEGAPDQPPLPSSSTQDPYNGIDPELAFLDPSLSLPSRQSSTYQAQGRFNARTGRFQSDPSMTPDRISEFKRGERQQSAYYDVSGWNESLGGKGLKRAGQAEEEEAARAGAKKKRVTSKDVEKFKAKKLEKQKAKLSWLQEK